jgi:hypothetical protein
VRRRPRRGLMLVLLVAAAVGCAAGNAKEGVVGAEADVRLFAAELERIHPNPYHATPSEEYARRVDELAARAGSLDRDQLVVELMRLLALLGERDGHSGIYTLHTHPKPLHLYPFRTYWFSDGLAVVGGEEPGAKLVAIDGVPIDEVVARVRPLITRDNEWSFRERVPYYIVCAEVLRGLGIANGARVTFTLESAAGRRDVVLDAIPAASYTSRFPYHWQPPAAPPGVRNPLWVRYRGAPQAVKTLQRGRFVYVAYTHTGDAWDLAERIKRLARKPTFRRVIVDVRQNGGGDNSRYFPLLDALASKVVNRRSRPVLLTGRTTFSAAGNFAADVEESTPARLIGEPPGGSPSQWGDFAPFVLPNVGLEVLVATQYVERGREGDTRSALEPHVRVEVSSADWLAGRDPVLQAALR